MQNIGVKIPKLKIKGHFSKYGIRICTANFKKKKKKKRGRERGREKERERERERAHFSLNY